MNMVVKYAAGIALAVMVSSSQGAAQAPVQRPAPATAKPQPFVGTWNCEVATFTFTDKTYNNGSETLPIRKITPKGKGEYQLDFPEGYKIMLQVVSPQAMNFLSLASGDGFSCKRLKGR